MRRAPALLALVLFCDSGAAAELRVRGRLTEASGGPAADVVIELRARPGFWEEQAALLGLVDGAAATAQSRSDKAGKFELAAPGPGVFRLFLRTRDGLEMHIDLDLLSPRDLGTLELPRSEPLELEVRGEGGAVVSGARVMLTPNRYFERSWSLAQSMTLAAKSLVTDEHGRVSVPAVVGAPIQATALAPGRVATERELRQPDGLLSVRRGQPLVLRVVEPDGRPAARALVLAEPFPIAATDEQGEVTLSLPPERPRSVLVISPSKASGITTLTAGREPASPLRLAQPVRVSGEVIAQEIGERIAGALVLLGSEVTLSGRAGEFELLAPAQRLELRVRASGYVASGEWLDARQLASFQRILLSTAVVLSGVVVDLRDQPVEGAEVTAASRLALTDASGRFRLEDVPEADSVGLTARAAGFAPETVEVAAHRGTPELRIVLRSGILGFGSVVDLENRPLAGAMVYLLPAASGALRFQRRVIADAETSLNGRFELRDLGPARYDLRVEHAGHAPVLVPGIAVPEGQAEVEIGTVTLAPGAVIEARVLAPDGSPIAGATAEAMADPTFWLWDPSTAASDAQGILRLGDLAAGVTHRLVVRHEGFSELALSGILAPTERPLALTLEPALLLQGTVVDEHDRPVEGALVQVVRRRPEGGTHWETQPTGSDGRFVIEGVPPGRSQLIAQAPAFQPKEVELELVADPQPPEVKVVLERGMRLQGRVLDTAGTPIEGASVGPEGASQRGRSATASDMEGRYELEGLPAGRVTVVARHEQFQMARKDAVLDGTRDAALDFELEPPLLVSGRVLGPGGEPVPSAAIWISDGSRGAGGGQASDSRGEFELKASPGQRFVLSADKDGVGTTLTPLEVQVGEEAMSGLELRLELGVAMAGRVLGVEQHELAGVRVSIRPTSTGLRIGQARPDIEGRFRVEHLPPGEWLVAATSGSGGVDQQLVTLAPGSAQVEVELDLGGSHVLNGAVLLAGEPVPNARVFLTDLDVAGSGSARTDGEGRFRIESLRSGRYELAVSPADRQGGHREEIEVQGDDVVVVELPLGTVTGRVLDAATGQAVPGASLTLRSATTSATHLSYLEPTGESDGDGAFRLERVAPGTYRLAAQKDGYARFSVDLEVESEEGSHEIDVLLERSSALILQVSHNSGRPASYVMISAFDERGVELSTSQHPASEGGRVELEDLPLEHWRLLLTEGDAIAALEVTVDQKGSAQPLPVTLQPSAALEVHVPGLAESGRGARLRLLDQRGVPFSWSRLEQRLVLAAGWARLSPLPAGAFTVSVKIDATRAPSAAVLLRPGETTRVNLD